MLSFSVPSIAALSAYSAIRIQVSIIYFHAFVAKLNMEEWLNGTILYYWLTDSTIGLPDFLKMAMPIITSSFIVILTWYSLILEILLFMALVVPKNKRRYLLVAGIIFHLGIALSMGLISFGFAMIAALILYLRPFDEEFEFSRVWSALKLKRVNITNPVITDAART